MRRRRQKTAEVRPRGSVRLLGDRTVGPFFFGRVVSTAGLWIHNVAAAIVVYGLTESATLVGAVSVAQFAPQFLLTPWSGAQADRGKGRRQVVAGRLIAALGSGGLVFLPLLLDRSAPESAAAAVIAAAFVVGVGSALGGPATHALLPSLVGPTELAPAVALNALPFTVARAAGPAVGALLLAAGGPSLAFGVAALCQLLFAAVLMTLRVQALDRPAGHDSSIRGAVRHLKVDHGLAALLIGITVVGIGADPVITLAPSIAAELDAGTSFVGALASSFGVGAAAAFVFFGWVRRRIGADRCAVAGLLVIAAGMATLAMVVTELTALAALAAAGAGMTFALTSMTTLIQERSPALLRGRVMALWSLAFLGSRPLAAAANGLIADATSADTALVAVAVLLLVGAWVCRPSRVRPVPALSGIQG